LGFRVVPAAGVDELTQRLIGAGVVVGEPGGIGARTVKDQRPAVRVGVVGFDDVPGGVGQGGGAIEQVLQRVVIRGGSGDVGFE
jgi:hypothetical protein